MLPYIFNLGSIVVLLTSLYERLIASKKLNLSSMDITNNQLTAPYCSSTSSSSLPTWDVFLSFYGKDTRNNFTSHLYSALDQAGIQTFMDDPELEKGKEMSGRLLSAIHGSKMSVVVLSKNYAYSRWCLSELVEILNCCRTNSLVVIPIFYYVDPSNVRHQEGSFGEALKYQKKRHSEDVVEKWKFALAEIGKLKGYHLKEDGKENEPDTIQRIVENVAPQAFKEVPHTEEYLFGLDTAVEDIFQKLSMESKDVRAIGICGMGGIGKTTVAKSFYNKYSNIFHISCFIENIKQHSHGGSPPLTLLEQLLIELLRKRDYKFTNIRSVLRQLKQILYSKKALIVLDDFDQPGNLKLLVRVWNLFSSGSRIIITTRDANLLNQLKVDVSEVDIYMVKKLKEINSLELFSCHAFGKPKLPESFRELSLSFVTYAGGLPLALKVLGSSLRGRTSVSFWKAKLEKVRVIPENEIQKILQLSYDELGDETEKAIFLYIAFFFIGKDKNEAVLIFESCGFFPEVGIPVLVERCLLTIDKNNMLQMHNLIQDMGRKVIREESKHGNRRCLYLCQGDASVVLQNLEGAEKIEGLIIEQTMSMKRHFSAKIFERMSNLRLLEIINVHDIDGTFENSFHELRYIRWHHCPWIHLPCSFRPPKLVSLDMPYSEFKTLWKGNTPLMNLKTINLSYSRNLKIMPDFTNLRLVEKLQLRGCKSLLKVHPTIGHLINLSHLDLAECDNLKELTEPIGKLTKLGHLDLHWCVNLKRLPEPIRQLTTLSSLNLGHCRNLTQLPEQVGDMKCLKWLNVSHTPIEQLPDSIGQLKNLVVLNMSRCKKLRKLPEQLGYMQRLQRFNASHSAIKHLPNSFAGLINLVNLHLGYCKNLRNLPNSLWKLKALEVLNLSGSSKLDQLPQQLGKMLCLKELTASYTSIEEVPDSIELLSRLQVLDLGFCKKLKYVPCSIWNLTSLAELYIQQDDISSINLPDTVKDMKLKSLRLGFNVSSWLPVILSFPSLETLHLCDEGQSFSSNESYSLSKLSNLQGLTLHNRPCRKCSFPELPPNLTALSIIDYTTLEVLPDLSSLKQLNLLCIWRATSLQALPPLPPHLEELNICECISLKEAPDLSMLKDLSRMSFIRCSNLKPVSLKQSSFQVTLNKYSSAFRADIPNRETAEWFSYKTSGCTLSFDFPPLMGDNFIGVALWIVYKSKYSDPRRLLYMRAVITNRTKGITKNYDIFLPSNIVVGEVQSRVECIRKEDISVESGDRIKISFQRLFNYEGTDVYGEVKVKTCGAHVIQKIASPPY